MIFSSGIDVTDCIVLRCLFVDDATEEYALLLEDYPLVHTFLAAKEPLSVPVLAKLIQSKLNSDDALLFGIFDKTKRALVGMVNIESIDSINRSATVDVWLGQAAHCQNVLLSEVVNVVITLCYEQLSIDTLFAKLNRGDTVAIHSYEKIGFVATKIAKSGQNDGCDEVLMMHWWWSGLRMDAWFAPPICIGYEKQVVPHPEQSITVSCKTLSCGKMIESIDLLLFQADGTEIADKFTFVNWGQVETLVVVYKFIDRKRRSICLATKGRGKNENLPEIFAFLKQRCKCPVDCLAPCLESLEIFINLNWHVISVAATACAVHRGYRKRWSTQRHICVVGSNASSNTPLRRFVLGTAQLGLPGYGIANQLSDLMPEQQADDIISTATLAGIGSIDTASAYGEAEKRVGKSLARLMKQFPAFMADKPPDLVTKVHPSAVTTEDLDRCIRGSTSVLQLGNQVGTGNRSLASFLLHRWSMRHAEQGIAWAKLLEWRNEAGTGSSCRLRKIGVSIQTCDELLEAAQDQQVEHVQLPFNLLDHRWRSETTRNCIQSLVDRGVIIHVRSVLLQGALTFSTLEQWPHFKDPAICKDIQTCIIAIQEAVREYGRLNAIDLALAYVRAQPWISGVVTGVNSSEMLLENLFLFSQPALTADQCAKLERKLPLLSENVLNPASWPKKEN